MDVFSLKIKTIKKVEPLKTNHQLLILITNHNFKLRVVHVTLQLTIQEISQREAQDFVCQLRFETVLHLMQHLKKWTKT